MSETATTSSAPTTGASNPSNTGSIGTIPKGTQRVSKGVGEGLPSGSNGSPEESSEKKESKKYRFEKLNVGGKEIDFEGDEDEVKRRIQQAYGANQAYHEAKKMREEAETKYSEYQKWKANQEEHKKKITSNPIQAAIEAGASPKQVREIAEKWLLEQIQEDEMSPDARRAKELQAELDQRKKDDEARTKKEQDERLMRDAEEARKAIVPEIMKHMDASGLARTAANLSSIAKRLQVAAQRKTPMTIERAVQLQHQDNQALIQSTLGGQTKVLNEAFRSNDTETVLRIGKEIESFLGEEALVALQRYGIVKWKSKTPIMPRQTPDTAKTLQATEQEDEISFDEQAERRRLRALELDRMNGIKAR